MTTTHIRGLVVRDESAAADAPLWVTAATEGVKGDGINLTMANVDLARFAGNPVLGYGHDYWGRQSLPIGRIPISEVDGARLRQELDFDKGDPFAVEVERKMRGRYLNAVSIGFDAHDVGANGVPARWELFETSVVPLPMDADALADDRTRGRALDHLFAQARAGKVLSAKNTGLIEEALAALSALLDAANSKDDGEGDARGLVTPRLAAARLRADTLKI